MKIGIIGAGISGMSLAQLLKDDFEVEILEKEVFVGGIARTKEINSMPYHVNGGHCFNSIYNDVKDFVFNKIMPYDKFNLIQRKALVLFKDNFLPYPIEFSIREIDKLDSKLAFEITKQMFAASYEKGSNLEEWFINHFGEILSQEYFIPYNTKIWGTNPKNMDNVWIKDEKQMKLPVPTKESFFKSLISKAEDHMPHTTFYYPKSNNQNTFLESLAKGLNIKTQYKVENIEKNRSKWIINGEKSFDLIVNTSPLDLIPNILKCDDTINQDFKKLKFNRVTTVFWETDSSLDMTWTYIPDSKIKCHRISNIGSFLRPNGNSCSTEAIGNVSYDEMIKDAKKIPFLKKPLDYNVTEHAYIFFDLNYSKSKEKCISYLNQYGEGGFISHGRFGEWEYYNMDVCIKRSIDLAKAIKSKNL
ncbi:NAD(P)-binding protein [uncultured Campylobacter sp.]|uniref:NAD(P)-binding protein n=1 Tax=uncultured Campylobacter sp. TaxID=218934 RepID=UPI00262ADFC0|nr:NAD(P)-binding protein [uncultured Campylobacter sp.]